MSDAETIASRRPSARYVLAAALLCSAVSEAVLDNGGFGPGSRTIFCGLALAALGAASLCDSTGAARAARQPVVVVLWLLGVLGTASVAWTVGSQGAALRWGLVTIGYGAVAVSAAVISCQQRGRMMLAVLISALALVTGLIGLYGAGSFIQPIANHTTGFWRPAGTLGYSSALSLLQVAVLPVILIGMTHRRRALATLAALAGAVAAAALALGEARLECTMALAVCLIAIAIPERTVHASRRVVGTAVGVLTLVGIGVYVVAGRKVAYDAHTHQLPRLSGIAAVCLAAIVVWALIRAPTLRQHTRTALLAAVVALTVAAVAVTTITGDTSHVVYVLDGGFFHGRVGIWGDAISTASSHLLLGHGADSALLNVPVELPGEAINDAYDLPLEMAVELGIPGFLLALALYGTSLRAVRLTRTRRVAWLFAPATLGFLLADVVDWEWHLAGSGAVWAVALGALLAGVPLVER